MLPESKQPIQTKPYVRKAKSVPPANLIVMSIKEKDLITEAETSIMDSQQSGVLEIMAVNPLWEAKKCPNSNSGA